MKHTLSKVFAAVVAAIVTTIVAGLAIADVSPPADELLAPYAEAAPYYGPYGMCGFLISPWILASTQLYASAEHRDEWAIKVFLDSCELGRFSESITLFGKQRYKWVKTQDADPVWCAEMARSNGCKSL